MMSGLTVAKGEKDIFHCSLRSMMYAVSGDPPSLEGAFQLNEMDVRCTSVNLIGPSGAEGFSEIFKQKKNNIKLTSKYKVSTTFNSLHVQWSTIKHEINIETGKGYELEV